MRRYAAPGTTLESESDIYRMLEQPGDHDTARARCTAYEVTATGPDGSRTDAVEIALEHRHGINVDMVVPIRADGDTIVVDVERTSASLGESRLWRDVG